MIRLSLFFAALAFLGCDSKKETMEIPGRYFYFTSTFPSDFYWNIITDYESKSTSPDCQKISMITGKPVAATKMETHSLKISGDTVKVPLFLREKSSCNYELVDVSLQDRGSRCIALHALLLMDDNGESGTYGDHKLMPNTLDFICKSDSSTGCQRCKETNGEVNLGFRMPKNQSNFFTVNLTLE